MRLSEITFEQCIRPGESLFYMHYDCSDALRGCRDQRDLDNAREQLAARYGDVEVRLHTDDPKSAWYDRVEIMDAKFQADERERAERILAYMERTNQWE